MATLVAEQIVFMGTGSFSRLAHEDPDDVITHLRCGLHRLTVSHTPTEALDWFVAHEGSAPPPIELLVSGHIDEFEAAITAAEGPIPSQ